MLSKNELKRRKKVKKPELDTEKFSAFKIEEKRYKFYDNESTDFSHLLSTESPEFLKKQIDSLQVYELTSLQGVYLIKDFLTQAEQIELTLDCINDYVNPPYRTNSQEAQLTSDINKQKLQFRYYFNEKIRWANLGYQYDWTSRSYPPQQLNIPKNIQNLCDRVLAFWRHIDNTLTNFSPESTIINIYGQKDTMGGHLDDAELDQKSPIFSLNTGLSAVFLLGGETKDVKPHALTLESGDLLIMSGDSRRVFHGVPRIIEKSFKKSKFESILPEETSQHVQEDGFFKNNTQHALNFLESHRLNLNFRQVYESQ